MACSTGCPYLALYLLLGDAFACAHRNQSSSLDTKNTACPSKHIASIMCELGSHARIGGREPAPLNRCAGHSRTCLNFDMLSCTHQAMSLCRQAAEQPSKKRMTNNEALLSAGYRPLPNSIQQSCNPSGFHLFSREYGMTRPAHRPGSKCCGARMALTWTYCQAFSRFSDFLRWAQAACRLSWMLRVAFHTALLHLKPEPKPTCTTATHVSTTALALTPHIRKGAIAQGPFLSANANMRE